MTLDGSPSLRELTEFVKRAQYAAVFLQPRRWPCPKVHTNVKGLSPPHTRAARRASHRTQWMQQQIL